MKISNETYDKLKLVALLIAPTIAFVSAILGALGYDTTVVVTILTALDTFFGTVVSILAKQYKEENKEE